MADAGEVPFESHGGSCKGNVPQTGVR
jgi:hypothetical protein